MMESPSWNKFWFWTTLLMLAWFTFSLVVEIVALQRHMHGASYLRGALSLGICFLCLYLITHHKELAWPKKK